MKKAVKIVLGCAAIGTVAAVISKVVKDIKEEKEYEESLEANEKDADESEFVDEDIDNETANSFDDEEDDFTRKVKEATPTA